MSTFLALFKRAPRHQPQARDLLVERFHPGAHGANAIAEWAPTHRHRKGGLYRVLGHATLETDRSDVTIYDDVTGQVWVRPTCEFDDGRFEALMPSKAP